MKKEAMVFFNKWYSFHYFEVVTNITYVFCLITDGYYIYIEATSNDEGEKSRLVSPVQLPGQYCLTFWYSMYGEDIGSLNVYKAMNGNETVIFTKDEGIGQPNWWKAVLTIIANETFQVRTILILLSL